VPDIPKSWAQGNKQKKIYLTQLQFLLLCSLPGNNAKRNEDCVGSLLAPIVQRL